MKSEAEILLAIRSDVRGAAQAIESLKATHKAALGVGDGFRVAAGAAGAYGLAQAFEQSAKAAILFNAKLEDTQLGLAGIYRQFQPKQFTDFEKAMGASSKTVDQLKKAALETTATFEDLLTAYQSIAGAAFSAGIPMEKQVRLTQILAQAVAGLGLPSWQLSQEGRSILTGNIGQDSTVARALGITNEMVNKAKAEGRMMEFLEQRLSGLSEAGSRANQTFSGQFSNLKDKFQQILGRESEGAFRALKDAFRSISEAMDKPSVQGGLRSLGTLAEASIRGVLVPGVTGAVSMAPMLAGGAAFALANSAAMRAGVRGGGTNLAGGPVPLPGARGLLGGLAVGLTTQLATEFIGAMEMALDRYSDAANAVRFDKSLFGRLNTLRQFDPIRASDLQSQLKQAYSVKPGEAEDLNVAGSLEKSRIYMEIGYRRQREIAAIEKETASIENLRRIRDDMNRGGPGDIKEWEHNRKLGSDSLEFDYKTKGIDFGTYLNARRMGLEMDASGIADPVERRRFLERGRQDLNQLDYEQRGREAGNIFDRMRIKGDFNSGRFANAGSLYGFANSMPTFKAMLDELRSIRSEIRVGRAAFT